MCIHVDTTPPHIKELSGDIANDTTNNLESQDIIKRLTNKKKKNADIITRASLRPEKAIKYRYLWRIYR